MATRRSVLLAGFRCAAWAVLSPAVRATGSSAASGGLRNAAAHCGLSVGIAADKRLLQSPSIAQAVSANFNLLTVSGMKWDHIHPQPDVFDFDEADWGVAFAEKNGMRVHGHNLCWNLPQAYPGWFRTALNPSNAERYLVSHIHTVVSRYRGRIDSWDVVNEPVVPWPGQRDGLYPGIWLEMLGPRYMDIAFQAVADTDPQALRVLNIHHVEQGTEENERNRRNAVALLRQLRSRGVPVDAIGLESHLDAAQPLDGEALRRFLEEVQSLGFRVMITELDVRESRATGRSEDWDRQVAQYYADYLNLVLPLVNAHRVIFWTLKDRWESGRRIQGLLLDSLSPRLSLSAVEGAINKSCS